MDSWARRGCLAPEEQFPRLAAGRERRRRRSSAQESVAEQIERVGEAAERAVAIRVGGFQAARRMPAEEGVVEERDRVGEDTMRLARETHELEGAIAHVASGEGLEAIARQQLGLVRPDEIVYRFHQPPPVAVR